MAPAVLMLILGLPIASALQISPVQKVLSMLSDMKAKGSAEMENEQKIFREYTEWVDDQTKQLGFEIKTAKSDIEQLVAFIQKADNDISSLAAEIEELDAEMSKLEAEQKAATEERDAEHKEYTAVQQDYSESLEALEQAIQVLSSQPQSVAQSEMLLQQMATTVPGMVRVVAALIQEKTRSQSSGAPAVAAYKSQSGGIIDMLEKLKAKFKDELDDVETEEANKAHAYDLEMLHLGNTIDHSKADVEEKSITKGNLAAKSGEASGKLAETKTQLAADEKLLLEIEATYRVKTEAYKGNQKVRADEIEAIGKAIEILSDPTVAESYAKHVKLVQTSKHGTSLLQVVSSSQRIVLKGRVATFLQRRATFLGSKALAALAAKIQDSPFAKVIGMIEKLLEKLKEEAAAEAAHKGWCDEQLHANKLKREKKAMEIEKLTSEIAVMAGQIETMGEQIKTLMEDQAALTKAMAEATEQRGKEKTENEATIKDAKAGHEAVEQALVVLKEFYDSQAVLLQAKQVPELKTYKGLSGASGGVLGMLEVILADFARLDAETTANEAQAAAEYKSFMADSKADKKQKHEREVKLKLDKDQAEFEKGRLEEDLASVQEEHQRALEYYESLKPACLEVHVSYEDRVARRKEEIEALKEAYQILDGVQLG